MCHSMSSHPLSPTFPSLYSPPFPPSPIFLLHPPRSPPLSSPSFPLFPPFSLAPVRGKKRAPSSITLRFIMSYHLTDWSRKFKKSSRSQCHSRSSLIPPPLLQLKPSPSLLNNQNCSRQQCHVICTLTACLKRKFSLINFPSHLGPVTISF